VLHYLPDSTSGTHLLDAARSAGIQIIEPSLPDDWVLDANGVRIHALDWGNPDRPPIIFLHGFAQQAHSWDFVALGIRDLCHVVSLDLRGHGDSGWPDALDYRISDYARDLEAVVATLKQKPIVCGLSLGGRVATAFASESSDRLRGLVIVDVGPEIARAGRDRIREFVESRQQFESFDELVAYTMQYTRRRRTIEQVRGSLRNAARELPDGTWTWKYDPRLRGKRPDDPSNTESMMWTALGKISCPTLLVRGGESDILSDEVARKMHAAMPGSQLAIVDGAGHLVPGDRPAAFVSVLRPFVQRLITGG